MAPSVTLVFPHQLFEDHPAIRPDRRVVIVEEWLFFDQFSFHQQKLVLHRASMQFYKHYLEAKNIEVTYIESTNENNDIRKLIPQLAAEGVREVHFADVVDDWLERRLVKACRTHKIVPEQYQTPNFLNNIPEVREFFNSKKTYFQADFYAWQRKKRNLLLTPTGGPVGGRWSFDTENRKKMPKSETVPVVDLPEENEYVREARIYVKQHYAKNTGTADPIQQSGNSFFPTTFEEAREWLKDFIHHRFQRFGVYEDAMVKKEYFLYHSVQTPALNIGLVTPQQIVDAALESAEALAVPMNSLEGYLRQVIGWREYIRSIYVLEGRKQRTRHFWGFTRKIPKSFWEGTTGILPVDTVIKRVLQIGYSHHIERLMVMGNFMLLCEFDPDDVYRWFMEMYCDAYDWVMVPNTYGMTQFSDGGLMMTKPYISGSNYIMKMSDYQKGEWQQTWDGLFWRFMHVHRDVMERNQRVGMLIRTFDNMSDQKKQAHLENAEKFLAQLDKAEKY
ncbi:cryptochrome/photolyase family protein [Segetibacter sp. 3557_3]|uniref:cryptochrome/photolyase family protein n=1 Tax=Segetibacter sp. 3557_3 TaxID=2547429 RepID=UPI001058D987|nr:cryptochrome/photolyase family protein [Segetibacter sp. 3557_3]TDH27973.1 cryptochrome/photolyase family protein [Segetibacter sp. 3557_3]